MDFYTSATLNASLWKILFFGILVGFLIYSAILIFHWFSFSMRPKVAVLATILYVTISAVFVVFMGASFLTLITL